MLLLESKIIVLSESATAREFFTVGNKSDRIDEVLVFIGSQISSVIQHSVRSREQL